MCSAGVAESYKLTNLGWMIVFALSRSTDSESQSSIPGWAGYKSLVSSSQSLNQVSEVALPLLPEVAHEWSTMLIVMLEASQLKSLAVGENHPTVNL